MEFEFVCGRSKCGLGRWGSLPLLVLRGQMSQIGHDYDSEHRHESEKSTNRQQDFFSVQHLFTLLVLLTPQTEDNACDESAQSDDKTTSNPAFRKGVFTAPVESVQYPKHDHQ